MTASDGLVKRYIPDTAGNIGSAAQPVEGKLRDGRLGRGQAYICFSDGSYATCAGRCW